MFFIEGQNIERMSEFKFLGSIVEENGRYNKEIVDQVRKVGRISS